MVRRLLIGISGLLLAASLGCGADSAPVGSSPDTTGALERMTVLVVGDSITADPALYRARLARALADHRCRFEFVGSMSDPGPAGIGPLAHEGHPGSEAAGLAAAVEAISARVEPDVVLVYGGGEDLVGGQSPLLVSYAIEQVIAASRAASPRVTVLVALPAPVEGLEGEVDELNRRLLEVVERQHRATSPVEAVDMNRGFDTASHLADDGYHPNESGSELIAGRWFEAYVAAVGSRSCDPLGS